MPALYPLLRAQLSNLVKDYDLREVTLSNTQDVINIHQTYLIDSFDLPPVIPSFVAENTAQMKAMHPNADYHMWSGEELRELIKNNFEGDVLVAFERLKPFSYKSDLGRMCIIFKFGGIYADLGMRFLRPFLPSAHAGFAAFKSLSFLTDSWTTMSTGIFWAKQKRPELECAIRGIVRNARDGYYGTTPLCPTGPVLFGRAIAEVTVQQGRLERSSDQWIGEVRRISDKSLSTCHVTPDGEITIMNMKAGRDLSSFGLSGVNNYSKMWHDRDIYR